MEIIYAPSGRAMEYAETDQGIGDGLAVNVYSGCGHGCRYCYVPATTFWRTSGGSYRERRTRFHRIALPRDGALDMFRRDCRKMQSAGDRRPVTMSFTCDPYQAYGDHIDDLTRDALIVAEECGITIHILTKGGTRAERDFDIMARNQDRGWKFGTTLCFSDDGHREYWEPFAASITDRIKAIMTARMRGIYTWVSLEPVVEPDQALTLIECLDGYVDFWKVGKLNGRDAETKDIEREIDWPKFRKEVSEALAGRPHLIKQDLINA